MILVIARFRPRAELFEDFVALLTEVQAASREDDGCLQYGYYSEVSDPMSFVAVEEWRDKQALDSHLRQPHVARLVAALPVHADSRPDVQVHEVSASERMSLPG